VADRAGAEAVAPPAAGPEDGGEPWKRSAMIDPASSSATTPAIAATTRPGRRPGDRGPAGGAMEMVACGAAAAPARPASGPGPMPGRPGPGCPPASPGPASGGPDSD